MLYHPIRESVLREESFFAIEGIWLFAWSKCGFALRSSSEIETFHGMIALLDEHFVSASVLQKARITPAAGMISLSFRRDCIC
jgi:hypothetical protein